MWTSAKRELRMIRGLLISLYSDNIAGWASEVAAVDACESGYAAVTAQWTVKNVREAGSTLEQW